MVYVAVCSLTSKSSGGSGAPAAATVIFQYVGTPCRIIAEEEDYEAASS